MNCVHLHGILAEKYGPTHRYHVSSAREAIRALIANKPAFANEIREMELRIVRSKPGVEHGIDLDETELELGMHDGELHIIPMPTGAKSNGGVAKIILGVALIAAVIITGGGAAAFGAGFAKGGIAAGFNAAWVAGAGSLGGFGGTVMLAGAALAIGGAAMMLAPSPKLNDGAAQKASFLFGNVGNVTEQGNPVPLVYGLTLTGSVVVALGIATEQIGVSVEYVGGDFGHGFGTLFSGGFAGVFPSSEFGYGGEWYTVDNYTEGSGPSIYTRTELTVT